MPPAPIYGEHWFQPPAPFCGVFFSRVAVWLFVVVWWAVMLFDFEYLVFEIKRCRVIQNFR